MTRTDPYDPNSIPNPNPTSDASVLVIRRSDVLFLVGPMRYFVVLFTLAIPVICHQVSTENYAVSNNYRHKWKWKWNLEILQELFQRQLTIHFKTIPQRKLRVIILRHTSTHK